MFFVFSDPPDQALLADNNSVSFKNSRKTRCPRKRIRIAVGYRRLLKAAQGTRLELVIQTICETGIRVSELKYITIEAVEQGRFYSQNRKNVI